MLKVNNYLENIFFFIHPSDETTYSLLVNISLFGFSGKVKFAWATMCMKIFFPHF
jgi:hypothetical protein